MKINNIELTNFRNYQSQQVFFKDGLNVLVGNNAQGKTNLLESIFLFAIGKSIRTTHIQDLIKWNCTFGKITLEILKKNISKKIDFYIFQNQNKSIKINGFSIKKISELLCEFNAVYFSPDDLRLIKESPNERRKFMDICLSQINKNYFFMLNKYNKILMQRNKLLKSTHNIETISQTIEIWNEQLATCGSYIINERLNFVNVLKDLIKPIHTYLSSNKENIDISYIGKTGSNCEEIREILINKYKEDFNKDVQLGYTSTGPHRDDIKIMLDDIDVRNFGSQGQQRTCALTLKLAELEFIKQNTGEYPVLLLDDVLSELDSSRQIKLLEKIKDIQTIITCTSFDFPVQATKYLIENGKIIDIVNN